MKYRPEIDGLRAIAVLSVILFHADLEPFSGGFVGVDVFFVISGYLITSIVLSEKQSESFSLLNFYERRARRILPALFLVVAACIPFAWLWLSPYELQRFAESVVGVVLFSSNFFFWLDGGYFQTANDLKPLLHTWSLAVEEQYYLLFPPVVIATWRFGKRWLFALLAFSALVSLGLAEWGAYNWPVATFFLLPTRGWILVLGASAAFYFDGKWRINFTPAGRQLVSALGLSMIAYSVFAYDSATPFPSLYALTPTVGALLIVLFATPETAVGRVLGTSVLVRIGLVSYSAYLWHQPVFAFARLRHDRLNVEHFLVLTIVVFVLSVATWRYVEQPLRKKGLSRKVSLTGSGLAAVCLLSFGLILGSALGPSSRIGVESKLAETLTKHPAVFVPANMDERIFIKHRIGNETLHPQILVIGSSRMMQVGRNELRGAAVLNLAVSGASIEDHIAITSLATKKFVPKTLLIGLDPWLLNEASGQTRWRSVAEDYVVARRDLGATTQNLHKVATDQGDDSRATPLMSSAIGALYHATSQVQYRAENDTPSQFRHKIRRDGSRVYDRDYASQSESQIANGFSGLLEYAMKPYRFSPRVVNELDLFLTWAREKYEVILVLSPYHPALYERMQRNDGTIRDIEREFVDLAARTSVQLVGSFNPQQPGCIESEFLDGMHPKSSCMKRVLRDYNQPNAPAE